MNSKELIEAANRLLEMPDAHRDLTAVCLHALATVREDDDEPATEEWAQENKDMFQQILIGFNKMDERTYTRGHFRKLLEILGGSQ